MNKNNYAFDDICSDVKYMIINNLSYKDLFSLSCVNKGLLFNLATSTTLLGVVLHTN